MLHTYFQTKLQIVINLGNNENNYVILYPPPFQVTICRPPQLSQGTVGGPFPIPVIGEDFESGCFVVLVLFMFEDKGSLKDCWFGGGSWLGGGRVLYLAESIDKTYFHNDNGNMFFEKG